MDDMKRICRHCGKIGTLRAALINGNECYTLSHYCPVKAAKRKAIKLKQEQSVIREILRDGVEKIALDAQGLLWNRYPYQRNDDLFSPVADDQKAFEAAYKRLCLIYYNFLKDNMKRPNKRDWKKILNKVYEGDQNANPLI